MENSYEKKCLASTESLLVDSETVVFLKSLVDADVEGDFLPDLFETFCSQTELLMADLGDAVRVENRKAISTIAHSMKSCCANIGACFLAGTFEDIEDKAQNAEWCVLENLVVSAKSVLGPTKLELVQEFGLEQHASH